MRYLARKRADDAHAAKGQGKAGAGDVRQSASEIGLDALAPHMAKWNKELAR